MRHRIEGTEGRLKFGFYHVKGGQSQGESRALCWRSASEMIYQDGLFFGCLPIYYGRSK